MNGLDSGLGSMVIHGLWDIDVSWVESVNVCEVVYNNGLPSNNELWCHLWSEVSLSAQLMLNCRLLCVADELVVVKSHLCHWWSWSLHGWEGVWSTGGQSVAVPEVPNWLQWESSLAKVVVWVQPPRSAQSIDAVYWKGWETSIWALLHLSWDSGWDLHLWEALNNLSIDIECTKSSERIKQSSNDFQPSITIVSQDLASVRTAWILDVFRSIMLVGPCVGAWIGDAVADHAKV